MRTIYAEYNIHRNSIDIYTSAGYMLRIDCWEAEKNLKTTPGTEYALTSLGIDEPLEYARLYLDGNLQMWVDAEDSLTLFQVRSGSFRNMKEEAILDNSPSFIFWLTVLGTNSLKFFYFIFAPFPFCEINSKVLKQ